MDKREALIELGATGFFRHWMGRSQRQALSTALNGEEGSYFAEMLTKLKAHIEAMPKTYETEEIDTPDKVVQLHYFRGGVDAWIVEKDIGDGTDLLQLQAFGKITLTGDKDDAEWGYISIQDLIDNNVELDLYWTPKPAREC